MANRRVLIAHPYVNNWGGSNAVAAWGLQALRESCEVSLATLGPVDCEAVNRSFGTSLRDGDFEIHVAPPPYRRILRWMPTAGALLECCLTIRWAQNLDRRRRFDLLFSTQNEADFGRRGLQYVHFPWLYLPRPDLEMRWFHRIPGLLWSYRNFCQWLGRASKEGLRRNLSLANSAFVAGKVREAHGIESLVLYPPVSGDFPEVVWERRRLGIAAVGRMHPCKRWEIAVEIVEGVRKRGHDLTLTLVTHPDDVEYDRRLRALEATRPWFRILRDLSRAELAAELGAHRFGIHTMQDEHFGIAPAELIRAGCITFVHNSGGPVEIVANDERLTFGSAQEGAGKVARVVENEALELDLRAWVAARREQFSAEQFCESLRRIVLTFTDRAPIGEADT